VRSAPVAAAVLAAAGLVWVAVVVIARGMGAMAGGMPASAGAFIATWTLMMAAMMLPALAPVAAMYVSLVGERRGHAAGLVAGYLVCWASIGVIALLLVRGVTHLVTDRPDTARIVVGVTLIACGAYQLTPLKDACLAHCRSPFGLAFHTVSRQGRLRDVRAGIAHAGWCIGCCGTLMVALVLLGAMSLGWMVAFTAVLSLEKVWRHGPQLARAAGIALVLLGIGVLADPSLAGILTPDTMEMGM
jgi:predicted metal-binding membrane protein